MGVLIAAAAASARPPTCVVPPPLPPPLRCWPAPPPAQVLSNDVFKAPVHRVLSPHSGKARYSAPFFFNVGEAKRPAGLLLGWRLVPLPLAVLCP